MKRSYGIQLFINCAFGMALGCSITLAMERASLFFTLVSIVVSVALTLNVACGYDENDEK